MKGFLKTVSLILNTLFCVGILQRSIHSVVVLDVGTWVVWELTT